MRHLGEMVTQDSSSDDSTGSLGTTADEATAVDAEPTKDFFISMLTRDIDLKDAIVDLVDNSIDGARRMRPDQDFDGLRVQLSFTQSGESPPVGTAIDAIDEPASFVIEDNCGGMSVAIARKYAFRFGRDTSVDRSSGRSIGQFGVGMKRTLFKMGAGFSIESKTTTERFVLNVVVDEWRKEQSWDFHFSELDTTTTRPERETGTRIAVHPLYADVGAQLNDADWIESLAEDLQFKHGQSIRNGAVIAIDGAPVSVEPLELLVGDGLRPAVRHSTYDGGTESVAEHGPAATTVIDHSVEVRLVTGLSAASSKFAGWYVYCNGRLILGPDKTRITAWGSKAPARNPIYHDQFARFRGYAFFESDDPSRLPWTTTKTGVDVDNAIWRDARADMIAMTRPVIDFLNLLDKQNTAAGGAVAAAAEPAPPSTDGESPTEVQMQYAERTLARATRTDVLSLTYTESDFQVPSIDASTFNDAKVRVSFARDSSEVDIVREYLGPDDQGKRRTNGDLGEEAWEYFLSNEIQR